MRGHVLAGAALALTLLVTPVAAQQAPADPVVVEALKEIEKYEGLLKSLQPGDKATANDYMGVLNPLGDRLKAVGDKNHPQWRDAAKRYNNLQSQIVATANKPAPRAPAAAAPATPAAAPSAAPGGSPPAAAAPAAPRLTSSDQARLSRVSNALRSLGQQIEGAHFQAFVDESQLSRFQNNAASQRGELEKLPAELPEVAEARDKLEQVEKQLAGRIADAKTKMAALGDIDAQLAEIDKQLQARKVPPSNTFKPEGSAADATAFATTLVELHRQAEADKAVLDKIEGAGIKNQTTERLRHWAVRDRQRSAEESAKIATQMMDSHVDTVMRRVEFINATDPANADHRNNHLLGEGRKTELTAELKQGVIAVETGKAFDAALGRKDGPDRAEQGRKVAEALTSYEQKYKTALGLARMPPAGMTDDKYIKIAQETLKEPSYGVGPIKRLLINSKQVQSKEKKEADIRTGAVSTTATIYHWVWDEYQVATAEKVGDTYHVFYNTLKFFHKGGPTTPTGRWILGDRFKSTEILEENIGK